MSISKIFHALLGSKSVIFEKAEFESDFVIFYGHLRNNLKRCSCCSSTHVLNKETKERTFRMLNLGQKKLT